MKTPFLGGSYTARSVNLNAQRCVNLYFEPNAEGGRDAGMLVGTPGLSPWVILAGEIRGLHVMGDYLYAVAGSALYKINAAGASTNLGNVVNSGRVTFADNGTQLVMATGASGYIYDGATLAVIGGSFPYGAKTIAYIDGFFLAEQPNTRQFFQSNLADGATWDALDFASKEGASDNVLSILADHRELWVFGERTAEVWYNAGTSTFAFSRIQGAFIEHGTAAAYSPAKLDNTVYWLGSDQNGQGVVYAASGYQPQRISTHAIELAINGYATIDDAFSWTYQQEGHSFYCLTFPTASKTWCFDTATNLWHERAYLNDTGTMVRHKANCVAAFDKYVVVGDNENGKLYRLDLGTYTDDSDEIRRLRSWGHLNSEGGQVRMGSLQLIAETGVGINVGQGSDPQLMLRWSDDGGHTWSNEHWVSAGKIGKYRHRAIWRRLGCSRDRVFEVSMSDPVKTCWISAELKAQAVA